jgi:uncharacterized membrane protein YfcA
MNNVVQNKSKILYQLQKLRRLAQPFFLPIDQCNGFQFIWLLISLLFCVGGIVLVVLTGIISFFESIQPIFLDKYFGGVVNTVNTIWSGWWGLLFSGLFLIGSGSFFSLRRQLKNRRWVHWLFLAVIVLMLLAVNGINAGIGFIIMLFLHFYNRLNLIRVNATKVVIVLVYTIGAFLTFFFNGLVDLPYGLCLGLGTLIGGWNASRFSVERGEGVVKVFLVISAIIIAVKLWFF